MTLFVCVLSFGEKLELETHSAWEGIVFGFDWSWLWFGTAIGVEIGIEIDCDCN